MSNVRQVRDAPSFNADKDENGRAEGRAESLYRKAFVVPARSRKLSDMLIETKRIPRNSR
jgi:hypothetical protein